MDRSFRRLDGRRFHPHALGWKHARRWFDNMGYYRGASRHLGRIQSFEDDLKNHQIIYPQYMQSPVTTLRERYRAALDDRRLIPSFLFGLSMLAAALVFNYFAAAYATERASSSVADIILSNIPVFDVDWIFVFGPFVFIVIFICVAFWHPKTLPFTAKSVAVFVIVRSFFIMLTHIGPFPDHTIIDGPTLHFLNWLSINPSFFLFSTGADLFFSGHTGLPFMLALVFWKHRLIRFFCLACSVFFGIIVLLGHLHYSIDVASAFFISYTIFIIATKVFPKDWERLLAAF